MKHNQGFLELVESTRKNINEMSTSEVADIINSDDKKNEFIIIDVRENSEWDNGHLPHATHLSKGMIECKIESIIPDKSQKIILYCGGGYRSALAAINLKHMGYTQVFSMWGGFRVWNEENLPLEKP